MWSRHAPDAEIIRGLGVRLRVLRLQLNLSQRELGDQITTSQQWVSKVEAGELAVTPGQLLKLCDLLRVTPNDLLEGLLE